MMRHATTAAAALCGVALAAAAAGAQTRDDFEYWDANGNGDLTCGEAYRGGGPNGLKLPAYRDDRDGTGLIYEWLERRRSSDGDDDGGACEGSRNPDGYVPKAPDPPDDPCPADAPVWRGLQVCDEGPREGYDRGDYGPSSRYQALKDDVIRALPDTMKAGGKVYTPYSCLPFDVRAAADAATDVDHVVALAVAHDSGIAAGDREAFAADLGNLTIADPAVNRRKGDHDAAGWTPGRHGAWYAGRVIAVKDRAGAGRKGASDA